MPGAANSTLDPPLYPRTYRPSMAWRVFVVLLGGGLATGGLFGTFNGIVDHKSSGNEGVVVASLLFVLLGGYCVISILMSKVVLSFDTVESTDGFSSRTMRREEVAGSYFRRAGADSVLVLVSRLENQKDLKIPLYIQTDDVFQEWLASVSDFDAQEQAKSLAELTDNTELGNTPSERSERVKQGKRVEIALNIGTGVFGLWSWIYPQPKILVIPVLAALPIVALIVLARSNGLFQLDGRRNDERPSLALPFAFPGMVLILRTVLDFHLFQYRIALIDSAILAVTLTFIAFRNDRGMRRGPWGVPLIFIVLAVYSFGLISQVNALADPSAPTTFQTSVLAKRISRGKSTTYYLGIDPWGPQRAPSEVSVPSSLYHSLEPGQPVCVNFRQGALKIAWYVVSHCD